jgi:hypothetical protein
LLPIIDKLLNAYKGEIDKMFWNNIFVERHGVGSSGIPSTAHGWLISFFPYIGKGKTMTRNNRFINL